MNHLKNNKLLTHQTNPAGSGFIDINRKVARFVNTYRELHTRPVPCILK